MPNCPKCGSEVTEEMGFCPKCGAPLKMTQVPPETRRREYRRGEKDEKGEKREKEEKGEKREKGEKGEMGFLGPLVGGLILIFIGTAFWLQLTGFYNARMLWAFFLILIGIVIIVAAVYGATVLSRRHPRPP